MMEATTVKPESCSDSRTVQAFARGREVLVWKAEDVVYLRSRWRVLGSLVGGLPTQPRQNIHLGLPLLLAPEETTLLLEEGVLELREYCPPQPSESERQLFQQLREEDHQTQLLAYQERRERARQQFQGRGRGEGGEQEKTELVEGQSSFSPLVCIHTADPRTDLSPSCFKLVEWTHPELEPEVLRYRVFRDLWKRGCYLTSGLKYGGDFLVYSGDPILVHSHHIAVVLSWQQPIPSLVSLGRLGSKVRKSTLFCSVAPDGDVRYFTLKWAGLL